MRFLFPGFLFALSAVAIPVIIHLFNFRKFKKVYFSNVAFLKEIKQQTSSSRNLKNLMLLAARVLAIIFLVLAFAQPFIPQGESKAGASAQQAVSIFIDNSYSMETLNKEGALLDEAKRKAKEIAAAYNINDKFQLLTNDFEGRHQRLLSYEDFITAVDEVKITGLNRDLRQILTRQRDVFSGDPNAGKTAYIISDFQKNLLGPETIQVDSSVSVRLVSLKANELANVSVDSVWFVSPVHRANDTERLVIQLKNNSNKPATNIPVKVTIEGSQKAIASLNVEPRSTSRDTLSFSGLSAGWKRGELRITDYPVIFDDDFYFTFNVRQQMPVLAINAKGENLYINSLYRAESFFSLQNVAVGSINYSQLPSYPFIVLTTSSDVSAALASQFKTYVAEGGTLMIFPASNGDLSGLQVLTQTLGIDVPEAFINQEVKVSNINLQHPIFSGVFAHTPAKVDLPTARKSVQYSRKNRVNKQDILSAAGRSFFTQYSVGKGKAYLSAVPLDEESGNFVKHSVFVPVMYQAAFLSLKDRPLFYTLGRDQYLETSRIALSQNQTLRLKKGKFEAIPDLRNSDAGTRLFISDQIKEKGIYQLMKSDSVLSEIAFNDNRLESDLSYLNKDELQSKFSKNDLDIFDGGRGSIQNAVKAVNNGIQLWKLCLILALVCLAAEMLIIRFYKRRESKLTI